MHYIQSVNQEHMVISAKKNVVNVKIYPNVSIRMDFASTDVRRATMATYVRREHVRFFVFLSFFLRLYLAVNKNMLIFPKYSINKIKHHSYILISEHISFFNNEQHACIIVSPLIYILY